MRTGEAIAIERRDPRVGGILSRWWGEMSQIWSGSRKQEAVRGSLGHCLNWGFCGKGKAGLRK